MRRLGLACALALWAGGAAAECRQALALGLDVSGSVDAREYRLQLDGLAEALSDPEVRAALLEGPGTVRLLVYSWSGPQDLSVLLPWSEVADAAALDAALARLVAAPRAGGAPTTALGSAMLGGGALLAEQAECWQLTLDISGDGTSNTGPRPQDVRDGRLPPGVTVNALVIGEAEHDGSVGLGELVAYFRAYVIRGPGSFTEAAMGYGDDAEAMRRKLLRELQSVAVGALEAPG